MHKNKFIFVLYLQLNLPVRQSVLGSWINLQGKTLIRTDEQQERSKFVWLQALCNAAMALGISLLYLLDLGSADLPVVFRWVSVIQHSAVLQCPSLQVPIPRQLAGRGGARGGLLLQWRHLGQ